MPDPLLDVLARRNPNPTQPRVGTITEITGGRVTVTFGPDVVVTDVATLTSYAPVVGHVVIVLIGSGIAVVLGQLRPRG